jgi:hypothetical protein
VDSRPEPEEPEVDDGATEPEPTHPQTTEAPRPISVPQPALPGPDTCHPGCVRGPRRRLRLGGRGRDRGPR